MLISYSNIIHVWLLAWLQFSFSCSKTCLDLKVWGWNRSMWIHGVYIDNSFLKSKTGPVNVYGQNLTYPLLISTGFLKYQVSLDIFSFQNFTFENMKIPFLFVGYTGFWDFLTFIRYAFLQKLGFSLFLWRTKIEQNVSMRHTYSG